MKTVLLLVFAAILAVGLVSYRKTKVGNTSGTAVKVATVAPPTADSSSVERSITAARINQLREENERLRAELERFRATKLDVGGVKIADLKELLVRMPEQGIPELGLATEEDWRNAVTDNPLESVEDYRRALAKLRGSAERRFAAATHPALQAYLEANNRQFPTDLSQLQSFLPDSIDRAMLQRYKIVPAEEVRNVGVGGKWAITQVSLADENYDSRSVIGPDGYGTFSGPRPSERASVEPVMRAYSAANGGAAPTDPSQLLPYAKSPAERAAIEKLIRP